MSWRLLDELPDADRVQVLGRARRRAFAPGRTLFREGDRGDALYLIRGGRVSVQVGTPRGEVATLAVLGAGDAVGELAVAAAGHVRTATVTAIERTETLVLHRCDFEALRRARPGVDRLLVGILARQVQRLTDRLIEALHLPAEARLLRQLAELAAAGGRCAAGTVVSLTQDDLAAMVGISRATANRILRDAQEAGAIRLRRGRVEILDPARLGGRAQEPVPWTPRPPDGRPVSSA